MRARPLRVLYLPEGLPASLTTVVPTPDGLSGLLSGADPVVVGLSSAFSLVVARRAPPGALPNVRVLDAKSPDQGMLHGPVIVIQHDEDNKAVDMDDGAAAVLRGFLGGKRVGVC